MNRYTLDEKGTPVEAPDLITWAKWYQDAERHVAKDTIGEAHVSTVFLGLDHSFDGGTPVLWETMVFGGPMDQEQDRCTGSREQAEAMHAEMVAKVRRFQGDVEVDRGGKGGLK